MEPSQSPQSNLPEDDVEVDTVSLACQEREKQGPWEVEFSYGGETDLHRHHSACTKNPGHQKFIPVDMFNVTHLPEDYQDKDLVGFVKALSALTVRVSVKYVSDRRPATIYGSDNRYPGYNNRGKDMMRVGTGWVELVHIYSDGRNCTCKECLNRTTPRTVSGHIDLRTATHVVFDKLEGEHTTCQLFFDRGNTPQACSGVVTLNGMSEVWGNSQIDYSHLRYVTHDLALLEKMKAILYDCESRYGALQRKYRNHFYDRDGFSPHPGFAPATKPPLTIIVSHPHGCSKQISVGLCTNSEKRKVEYKRYKYTAATCPGSSGAFVFVLGTSTRDWYLNNHAHSGNSPESKELNYSGLGLPYLPRLATQ